MKEDKDKDEGDTVRRGLKMIFVVVVVVVVAVMTTKLPISGCFSRCAWLARSRTHAHLCKCRLKPTIPFLADFYSHILYMHKCYLHTHLRGLRRELR